MITLFKKTDQVVRVPALKDALSGAIIEDATVTGELFAAGGASLLPNISFVSAADGTGNYDAQIPNTFDAPAAADCYLDYSVLTSGALKLYRRVRVIVALAQG